MSGEEWGVERLLYMIAIASIVRNEESSGNLGRFLTCCTDLESHHPGEIIYIFVEGDSTDMTYDTLRNWVNSRSGSFGSVLEKHDRGYPVWGKSRDVSRTNGLASLRNRLIELVLGNPYISEILFIDANYGFKGDLVDRLRETGGDISAAMSFTKSKDGGGRPIFFDIWAFRMGGYEFSPFWPYMRGWNGSSGIVDVDSVGSGYLVKRRVLESGARYSGGDCEHVGFSKGVKDRGFSIKVNTNVCIVKEGTGFSLPSSGSWGGGRAGSEREGIQAGMKVGYGHYPGVPRKRAGEN